MSVSRLRLNAISQTGPYFDNTLRYHIVLSESGRYLLKFPMQHFAQSCFIRYRAKDAAVLDVAQSLERNAAPISAVAETMFFVILGCQVFGECNCNPAMVFC